MSYIIQFEGVECAGKTTQAKMLHRFYPRSLYFSQPCGTELGIEIRKLERLLRKQPDNSSSLLLYSAARANFYHLKLKAKMRQARLIILDRFLLSTAVYHGDQEAAFALHRKYCDDVQPDFTIIFDIDYNLYYRRLNGRAKSQEHVLYSEEEFNLYRKRYLSMVQSQDLVLDGGKDANSLHEEIKFRLCG